MLFQVCAVTHCPTSFKTVVKSAVSFACIHMNSRVPVVYTLSAAELISLCIRFCQSPSWQLHKSEVDNCLVAAGNVYCTGSVRCATDKFRCRQQVFVLCSDSINIDFCPLTQYTTAGTNPSRPIDCCAEKRESNWVIIESVKGITKFCQWWSFTFCDGTLSWLGLLNSIFLNIWSSFETIWIPFEVWISAWYCNFIAWVSQHSIVPA